jgi:hypothetical protein
MLMSWNLEPPGTLLLEHITFVALFVKRAARMHSDFFEVVYSTLYIYIDKLRCVDGNFPVKSVSGSLGTLSNTVTNWPFGVLLSTKLAAV